jgi:N-acetylglucosaminyl-diphospho-decaprenol L-rhamnosyltransferase
MATADLQHVVRSWMIGMQGRFAGAHRRTADVHAPAARGMPLDHSAATEDARSNVRNCGPALSSAQATSAKSVNQVPKSRLPFATCGQCDGSHPDCGARDRAEEPPAQQGSFTRVRGLYFAYGRGVATELLVVILNYRTAEFTTACLRSLDAELAGRSDCRAVVVDGGSGDGSAERLRRFITARYSDWAELLALEHNGGFAYGNNAAIRRALQSDDPPRFIYLLNPDTLVRPGAIDALLRFAHDHPKAGIVGSRCEDSDGMVRPSAFRFHSAWGELEAEAATGPISRVLRPFVIAPPPAAAAQRTDWVSGAAMLIRREVFERIGLLDEGFFLYYEETDFALRAARAGFECWYLPESRVLHYCGQATGVTGAGASRRRVPRYWYESRRRYFTKHHGRLYAALADAAWVTGASIRRTRGALHAKPASDPPHQYRDFLQYNLPRWVHP